MVCLFQFNQWAMFIKSFQSEFCELRLGAEETSWQSRKYISWSVICAFDALLGYLSEARIIIVLCILKNFAMFDLQQR